jgi:hypothetical protein
MENKLSKDKIITKMDKNREVTIIYELSEEGQKDAFLKGLNSNKVQKMVCNYEEYMEDIISIDDNGKAIIDTRDITYDYRIGIFGIEVEEVKNIKFDSFLGKEQILKWIEDELNIKRIKSNKYNKIDRIVTRNLVCFFVLIVLFAILGFVFNKKDLAFLLFLSTILFFGVFYKIKGAMLKL